MDLTLCRKLCKPRFRRLVDLIAYYKKNPLIGTVSLKKAIVRPPWLIPPSALRSGLKRDELGRGNFAVVFKGIYERANKPVVTVAVKQFFPGVVDEEEAAEANRALFREANLMSRVCHPNVITFYGLSCDYIPVMLILELANESLDKHLTKCGTAITHGERLLFSLEAARGMWYIKNQGLIHRDLAARNCLIGSNGIVKISDFGLSIVANQIEESIPKNLPLRWIAPEVISRTPVFSFKSDVWSYGILVFEIWNNGIKPWPNEDDNKKIATDIRKGQMPTIPLNTPAEVAAIIKNCWQMDPKTRPEFMDIMKALLAAQKSNPILTRPNADACTTNQIPGVKRLDPADEELEASITGYQQTSGATLTTTTTEEVTTENPSNTDVTKSTLSMSKKKIKQKSTKPAPK